ncbi:hypothetical protein VP01_10202g1, partial [Puccinia sorghi]
ISLTVKILQIFKPFFSLENFFSQMTLALVRTTYGPSQKQIPLLSYLKQQFFTLFRDPNEVLNSEFQINSLSMKDNGKASTYLAQFRNLQSR